MEVTYRPNISLFLVLIYADVISIHKYCACSTDRYADGCMYCNSDCEFTAATFFWCIYHFSGSSFLVCEVSLSGDSENFHKISQ